MAAHGLNATERQHETARSLDEIGTEREMDRDSFHSVTRYSARWCGPAVDGLWVNHHEDAMHAHRQGNRRASIVSAII